MSRRERVIWQKPDTVEEACALLSDAGGVAVGGGTMLAHSPILGKSRTLVDVRNIPDMYGIECTAEGDWSIGAASRCVDLINPRRSGLGCLAQSSSAIGSPQLQNQATVGGNLGAGKRGRGLSPVLVALGATLVVADSAGESMTSAEVLAGGNPDALSDGGLIVRVVVPQCDAECFQSAGSRAAFVPPTASAAVVLIEGSARVRTAVRGWSAGTWMTPEADRVGERFLAVRPHAGTRTATDVLAEYQHYVVHALPEPTTNNERYEAHAAGVLARRAFHCVVRQQLEGRLCRPK